MNPIDTSALTKSALTDVLTPDQPTLTEQVTDKMADMVLEHSKDLATQVVLPAAKYTIGAKLFRNRRQIGAVLIGLVLVGAVATLLKKKRSGGSDDSLSDADRETLADIPTISDREAAA